MFFILFFVSYVCFCGASDSTAPQLQSCLSMEVLKGIDAGKEILDVEESLQKEFTFILAQHATLFESPSIKESLEHWWRVVSKLPSYERSYFLQSIISIVATHVAQILPVVKDKNSLPTAIKYNPENTYYILTLASGSLHVLSLTPTSIRESNLYKQYPILRGLRAILDPKDEHKKRFLNFALPRKITEDEFARAIQKSYHSAIRKAFDAKGQRDLFNEKVLAHNLRTQSIYLLAELKAATAKQ